MGSNQYDAIVIGAGFGGIYQLHSLLKLGLKVLVLDAASDVGGTWYWNRYPGAMSDTEAYIYRYSWDKDDLLSYHWNEHYIKQKDALAYLTHVVKKYDLRQHMKLNTEMISAQWDDNEHVWRLKTQTGKDSSGEDFTCRYLVTALGLLSKQNFPDLPGMNDFKGEIYHTGHFPKEYDFSTKRVGVIGCGSTGVQVITNLGPRAKQLLCFQRHPQYSVPSGDGPVSKEYRDSVNSRYDEIWDQVKNSGVAFGFEESQVPAMSVSAEERQRKFQEAWDMGNGFRFMFWTFSDLTTSKEANEEACKFIRSKIAETVKDPEKRRKLTPHDFYARRPLCDGGYYQQFNRDSVDVIDIKETPITALTENGLKTSDGKVHELDVIIFATGFDAVDGNYTRVAIKGRSGKSLKEHWAEGTNNGGPTSYLGVCVADFPNLFMITGPNGPFTNIPPTIETHVEFIAATIAAAEAEAKSQPQSSHQTSPLVEATPEAEKSWTALCDDLSKNSLFRITDSWIFGANVPGKKNAIMFFFGGLADYRRRIREIESGGYDGFRRPFYVE